MLHKLLFVGFLVTASSAIAQSRPNAASKPRTLVAFDTVAAVVRMEEIALPSQVFAAFRQPPRTEFETSQAYRARLNSAALMPLGVRFDGDDTAQQFKYDADKQEMTFSFGAYPSSTSANPDGVVAGFYRKSLGFSTGTNSYGAKIQYEKITVHSLQFRPIRSDAPVTFDFLPTRAWLMPTDSAKSMKPFLAAVLVIVPTAPSAGEFIWQNRRFYAATADSPIESNACSETISVSSLALWIYDVRNGRVLQKFDLSYGDPPKSLYTPVATDVSLTPCT